MLIWVLAKVVKYVEHEQCWFPKGLRYCVRPAAVDKGDLLEDYERFKAKSSGLWECGCTIGAQLDASLDIYVDRRYISSNRV